MDNCRGVISALVAAGLLLTATAVNTSADEFKRQICALGINLGSIASREFFFGRAFATGQPPADQVADIAANVGNIVAHTGAAESLMAPLQPSGRAETVRQFTTEISAYMGARGPLNYTQRENKVANLAGRYRQSLQWTYNSSRPDSVQYQPNCASFLFTACYEFGYAATAAAVGDTSSQNSHVGAMRSAIRSGMSLAFDRERQSNAEQVCCNMGSQALWAPILSMTGTRPHALFVTNTGTIQTIALSVPAAQCAARQAGNYLGCYAEDRHADVTGLGNRVLGGAMIADDPAMTVDKCVGYCGAKGFAYAGLQYSKWCFCGNSYADRGEAKNCNMACSGDSGETCGGAWANSVYGTSAKGEDPTTAELSGKAVCPAFGYDYAAIPGHAIEGHNDFGGGAANRTVEECKRLCDGAVGCRSFDYLKPNKACYLSKSDRLSAAAFFKSDPKGQWDYYEQLPRIGNDDVSGFEVTPGKGIAAHNDCSYKNVDVGDCAAMCKDQPWCRSFEYDRAKRACNLSTAAAGEGGQKLADYPSDYYSRTGR